MALSKLLLEYFEEGLCAQVMHIGRYATEPATIERMRDFMKENRYRDCVGLGSKHYEIYLGDRRKADYFTSYPLRHITLYFKRDFIRCFRVPFYVKYQPPLRLKDFAQNGLAGQAFGVFFGSTAPISAPRKTEIHKP